MTRGPPGARIGELPILRFNTRPVMQRTLLIFLAVLLVLPVTALAQSSGTNLADIVPNLILTGITLPGGEAPGNPHAGHFTLGNPTFGGSQAPSRVDAAART